MTKEIVLVVVLLVAIAVKSQEIPEDLQLDAGDAATLENIKDTNKVKGIDKWKDQCREKVGQQALDDIKTAQQDVIPCVTQIIDIQKLRHEVNISIPRGELDTVFKKYCRKRDEIMNCFEDFFSKIEVCLDETQLRVLNNTRRMIDAAIDFVCYKEGDRIAVFMAEKGEECVKSHMKDIQHCVEERVPDIKNASSKPPDIPISVFTINEENCQKVNEMHKCVVKYTERCDDPTPSNILDSLIKQVLKVTPCWQTSSASPAGLLHFLPHLLTLLAGALTAANILL